MKQAVILIHGIGEQQPMDTSRGFVEALLAAEKEEAKFYSKPDTNSDLFELRRFKFSGRYPTDFYEYYWAYNVDGTNLWDVVLWLWRLIRRPKLDVPEGLVGFWWLTYLVLLPGAAALVYFGGAAAIAQWFKSLPTFGLVSLALLAALLFAKYIIVYFAGDAARYLSPRPRNIKLRQSIRREGIALLRKLHESGEYDRIVVVGHSLGSVIGYDVISHYWQETNELLPKIGTDPEVNAFIRDRLEAKQQSQPFVADELASRGNSLAQTENHEDALNDFRQAQVKAWNEQRFFGNPWLVTDFVTLGSPLAHAMLLLTASNIDFRKRKLQRELLTCPPLDDSKGYGYSWHSNVADVSDQTPKPQNQATRRKRFTPIVLHHGAPFAVTRWTNLYFPVKWIFFGDIVGGKLAQALGLGIKDVAVKTNRWAGYRSFTPMAHNSYWEIQDAKSEDPANALQALKAAVALNRLRDFRISPPVAPSNAKDKAYRPSARTKKS
jgi:hypothetical protein